MCAACWSLDRGAPVRSGGTNAGGPFHLRVTASAAERSMARRRIESCTVPHRLVRYI